MLIMMSTTTDINAKTPSHKDAEKIENVLAALLNFGQKLLRNGIERIVNDL